MNEFMFQCVPLRTIIIRIDVKVASNALPLIIQSNYLMENYHLQSIFFEGGERSSQLGQISRKSEWLNSL